MQLRVTAIALAEAEVVAAAADSPGRPGRGSSDSGGSAAHKSATGGSSTDSPARPRGGRASAIAAAEHEVCRLRHEIMQARRDTVRGCHAPVQCCFHAPAWCLFPRARVVQYSHTRLARAVYARPPRSKPRRVYMPPQPV